MKNLFILTFAFLLCHSAPAMAQQSFTISGIVRDQKETLPGVAIYLSGYQQATVTNNEGKFVLSNLKPGNYDIMVQLMGYQPVSKNVVISDRSVVIDVTLNENTTLLKEVVVRADPNREYYINLFKQYFIGISPNAQNCRILNISVISAWEDKSERMLRVSASDLIIIENQSLGYRIKYLLNTFEYDYKNKMIFFAGLPTFEEIKAGKAKQKRWEKKREIAYRGSSQHFYKALYENRLAEEQFALYKLIAVKNDQKLPDSLIKAKVRKFSTGPNGVTNLITFNGGSDSLSYWLRQRKVPAMLNILNKAPILIDTLVRPAGNVLKEMDFSDDLFVVYKGEKEDEIYDHSGFKIARPIEIGNAQVSLIKNMQPPIQFYPNGAVFSARSALYSGFWSYEKVADLLPLDYLPPKK